MDLNDFRFSACLLLIAMVYASVGQAGASGYVAILGLAGLEPHAIKLAALALNLLVATIGTAHFWRSGRLSWRTAYPFAILGFPFSLLGGAVHLAPQVYVPVVSVILILSAGLMGRSLLKAPMDGDRAISPPPFLAALAMGAAIGFISGVTGTGGTFGAVLGSRYLPERMSRGMLALLLLVSGIKLLLD